MERPELREERHELPLAERDRGRHPERPARDAAGFGDALTGSLDLLDRRRDAVKEGDAGLGQGKAPRRPLEQPAAELVLEPLDRPRHDRRIDMAIARHSGEATALHNLDEDLQRGGVHDRDQGSGIRDQ